MTVRFPSPVAESTPERQPSRSPTVALRMVILVSVLCLLRASGAAAPQDDPPQPPFWADPEAMFEAIFDKEGDVDEELLADIEVSAQEEERIGKTMVDSYLASLREQGLRVVERGRDVEYLRQLTAIVHPMMDNRDRYPRIKVYLVLSGRCDARSFPGGHLVFFRGLLESAGNEAALIGIVGHELAHLDRGHHTRRVKQTKLQQETFSAARGPMRMEDFFQAGGVMMRAWMRPFRADYEREADLDGARWSYRAGYDCREMGRLFLRLHQQDGNRQLPVPEFFRSHPAGPDRHRAIMEEYERLQAERPNDDLVVGIENLRRRRARRP